MQCDKVDYGDETLHTIGHCTHCSENRMHKYLTDWMESHQYFVEKVGGDLVHRKGLTVEDYMYNVVQPHVPLDEIGILLYSRMNKMHITIILEGKYWTTNRDEALKHASLYLVYLGRMQFMILQGKAHGILNYLRNYQVVTIS